MILLEVVPYRYENKDYEVFNILDNDDVLDIDENYIHFLEKEVDG